MIKIDITNTDLFESLLEIEETNNNYDLHNDFNLNAINFNDVGNILSFEFIENSGKTIIHVIFEKTEIVKFKIPVLIKELVLDNFHRGRYEENKKLFDEYKNKKCFYIEFYEDGEFVFLTSKAYVLIENNIEMVM